MIVHHVDQLRADAGLRSHWRVDAVKLIGPLGVTLFFVLSGFLITYLLLIERETTGRIAVRAFYVRRMLRIWPLYFLLVALGFFVFPRTLLDEQQRALVTESIGPKLAAFVLLCPNVALFLWPPVPLISHLWSVGSEEQFYLLWPALVRGARQRLPIVLLAVIVGVGGARWALFRGTGSALTVARFLDLFRVDCMAIGGVGALLLHGRSRALAAIYRPAAQVAALVALVAVALLVGPRFALWHQVYAALFLVVILNVASNPRPLVALESRLLRFLGRISYGLYMYHPGAIAVVLAVAGTWLRGAPGVAADAVAYGAALLLTVGVAAASYYGFERPFLRLKERFAVVHSGPEDRRA